MPKSSAGNNQGFAYQALLGTTSKQTIGFLVEVLDEGDSTESYLFESKLKGYVGWRWSVTVYAPEGQEPTVSEVLLMPGVDSLVAPDWVPWSERLADYKALQAELEAQAALDAEEAEESDDSDEADDVDEAEDADALALAEEQDEAAEVSAEDEEASVSNDSGDEPSLAVADLEEGENAKGNAEKARRKPPRFLRRRKRGAKNKSED
ncbi:DUF3027 domain-containing protein [Rhodoluna sp. KAS3]|uniref:DUF3027 domain-containing protein n=1 Tax=Rhodoluna sp. KAS3 TaxID=942880 RepID=UPI00222F82C8|nr:DUF3027 domain-containing protein [Rhodoluna sp. KAS3]BDS49403.1 hypothetical protein RKAS3_09800 [Rhodoluna sp. KAS3]